VIVILGPTASGKTKLAAKLAYAMNAEIISADSRQVYQHMNIGTGKDYDDYIVQEQTIPVHLIDVVKPGSKYHVHQFQQDFEKVYSAIQQKNKTAILCGGTGLYLQSVLQQHQYTSIPVNEQLRTTLKSLSLYELVNYFNNQPETAFNAIADLSTPKRAIRAIEINLYLQNNALSKKKTVDLNPFIIGLNPGLELRRSNIEKRLLQRIQIGLIEEVDALHKSGLSFEQLEYYGLEYKFVAQYLQGLMSKEALLEKLTIAIQQFAKRQMTYFRKMEKDGLHIHWIDFDAMNEEVLYQKATTLLSKTNTFAILK